MASLAHNIHAVGLLFRRAHVLPNHLINKELGARCKLARRGAFETIAKSSRRRRVEFRGEIKKLSGRRCLGGWRHCTWYLVVDICNWAILYLSCRALRHRRRQCPCPGRLSFAHKPERHGTWHEGFRYTFAAGLLQIKAWERLTRLLLPTHAAHGASAHITRKPKQ